MFAQLPLDTIVHNSTIYDVEISKDNSKILYAGKDSIAYIWHADTRKIIKLKGHDHAVSSISYNDKHKSIISADYSGNIYQWNDNGDLLKKQKVHNDATIKIYQQDDFISTASRDKTVNIWKRNENAKTTLIGHSKQVNDIKYYAKKKYIITGSWDKTIKVWSLNGDLIKSIEPHDSGIRTLAILENKNYVMAGHRDGKITITDFINDKLIKKIDAHGDIVTDIELVENEDFFISSSADKSISFWDTDGNYISSINGHTSYVSGISYSNGLLVSSSGSPDNSIKIWNASLNNLKPQKKYSCNNKGFDNLKPIIGTWFVNTKDRTAIDVYQNNTGYAITKPNIDGCGVTINLSGSYKNHPYALNMNLMTLDRSNAQMSTVDSEHGSFSLFNGKIKDNSIELLWYRDIEKKKLQSKYKMTIISEDAFEFSSYLSTDYGNYWALTYERKYQRIKHKAIHFKTKDSVTVYGDSYTINKTYPTILLFHQGGSNSRGEYKDIKQKLLSNGYNIITIDQRVGGSLYYGNYNRTIMNSIKKDFDYCEAYPDLEATLDYAIKSNYTGKKILWGSSYSAALAIQLSSKNAKDVDAILAFSPSTGNAVAKCHPNSYLEKNKKPLLLLRPKREMHRESSIIQFNLAEKYGHQTYIAEHGIHGSSMLVEKRVNANVDDNWEIVLAFLKKI
ncbi:hypothetical protein [uncultured Winogradskyella sp.]|uniref:S9 family peptidase n=1 Tax=uncultured Winogradskyella sp. TaxID=395353 RepID=UPI002625C2FD|nr:hypothetical protein [uncultured Winogradskyella sp.]